MQVPIHPLIVHFPIAITFILPVLIFVIAFLIKANKLTPKGWFIIVGLQMLVVATGYISLETGDTEGYRVEKVVSKKVISEHEEAAEIFVGSTVLTLALSIAAYFIRKEIGFAVKIGTALLTVVSCYLAYNTGTLGGALVYTHGAASAYMEEPKPEGLLPVPGKNTSESEVPVPGEENESLKPDENDYGNSDEVIEDEFREED